MLTVLLQLFDEVIFLHQTIAYIQRDSANFFDYFSKGRITDGRGKTTICKDAIFIMTSNLANDEIADHALQLRNEAEMAAKRRVTSNNKGDLL